MAIAKQVGKRDQQQHDRPAALFDVTLGDSILEIALPTVDEAADRNPDID
jgi:hypothetical protein